MSQGRKEPPPTEGVEALFGPFEQRVLDARGMFIKGCGRAEIQAKHGGCVLRAALDKLTLKQIIMSLKPATTSIQ